VSCSLGLTIIWQDMFGDMCGSEKGTILLRSFGKAWTLFRKRKCPRVGSDPRYMRTLGALEKFSSLWLELSSMTLSPRLRVFFTEGLIGSDPLFGRKYEACSAPMISIQSFILIDLNIVGSFKLRHRGAVTGFKRRLNCHRNDED